MRVLDDSRTGVLAVAGRVARVARIAPGESVVAAEPQVVRGRVPHDPEDGAELLASLGLCVDDPGAAEDVVVDDREGSVRLERHAIRVAALVDGWVAEQRPGLVIRVPVALATISAPVVLALISDED